MNSELCTGVDTLALVLLGLCLSIVVAMWVETIARKRKLNAQWPR